MGLARRIFRLRGTVQGVGFRPFVHRTARELGLAGSVWNDADGVVIDAEGTEDALDSLAWKLANAHPPAARVEAIETANAPPTGRDTFVIEASHPGSASASSVRVSADLATCAPCRHELLDPRDRRYRYPFINCTDCGPRYSIARDVPYDRATTTMSVFPMCRPCRDEYESPGSRRFHAQPNACPECGPHVWIHDGDAKSDPVEAVVDALRQGAIIAVKGLGGFHLACDAGNDAAVSKLRERKRRPEKPFAVMFVDLAAIEREAVVEPVEREALSSPHSPIVLLRRRNFPESALSPRVAPGLEELGCFLPYTPLHHLLLRSFGGPLVMTSGNLTEEPIASGNEEALERLHGIADLFLFHDREIHMRSDDSVVRVLWGRERVQRRARGYVPEAIELVDAPRGVSILAVGADLKNTLCVASGGAAVLSQHIGDLESFEAQEFFHEVRANLERLYQAKPSLVAHDLHPGYHSTRIAQSLGLPTLAVQHHHAHIASCLTDNGRRDRVIGVAWDGTGYGTDGSIWGGEFLVADLSSFERVGRIRPVALPGGDAAVREPWRMAVSHLIAAGLDTHRVDRPGRSVVESVIRKGFGTVPTSSAGRLFDAVASVLGIRHVNSYEAQAAIELEALSRVDDLEAYESAIGSVSIGEEDILEIDPRVTWRAIVADLAREVPVAEIGGRFHLTLASAIARVAELVRERTGLETVALSGGCFHSRLLTTLTRERLSAMGFETLVHRRVPPGDGGISLGQAAVAAWTGRDC